MSLYETLGVVCEANEESVMPRKVVKCELCKRNIETWTPDCCSHMECPHRRLITARPPEGYEHCIFGQGVTCRRSPATDDKE